MKESSESVLSKKVKASAELVLAAQLNQARETIIVLKRQLAEQSQIITQLQGQVYLMETQALQQENEKLRVNHGLKIGQKLEKDDNGEWWVTSE